MATRRSLLAALAGFVGGAGAATYTEYPERWDLPDSTPLPPIPEQEERTPMPTPEPGEAPDPDSLRGRARQEGLEARPGVVYLEIDRGGGRYGAGTGWVLDEGRIVTNGHVVGAATDVTCYTLAGERLEVEVVGTSQRPDVALLATDDPVPATLPTGSSDDLESDQPLVQVGHPGGVGYWVISLGRLRRGRGFGFVGGDQLVSTVPSAQGSSGSPLLNLDGEVVGLTYAGVPETTRRPGSAPEPSDPRVRESFEVDTDSLHVPVETVLETVADWG
ncbi:trypsin-like peptidase domain-containing protein [Halobium salinum]|uniref:Trypsin-like peptidase domain-containing protein n=1 Tax=Halobium salinum TaxID=1364940 RepID=A0ABD5PDC7_9EURY|nr:serine protease [Halobium salinum]